MEYFTGKMYKNNIFSDTIMHYCHLHLISYKKKMKISNYPAELCKLAENVTKLLLLKSGRAIKI